ncbi:Thioesterase-like superfamily [Carpediemonas membranifera]|uniref:Thioesterase-like superfamily n=1 Tax=Carpediemonas membranifera TaxID=201153 RepID=A0A8J6B4H9_9EUKA|nr:Thioesterase-like superfamily [Carpediemonas membranifera]|eukprot:KAG9394144.1 Thioesterase-like superfamily [Carpediemonas membranifera]
MLTYLIRIIWCTIAALLKSKKNLMSTFTLKRRCTLLDIDYNMHMNNAAYFSVLELGRHDAMVRAGLLKFFLSKNTIPICGGGQIRYRRSVQFMAKYTIRTRIIHIDEKTFFFRQEILVGKNVAATAMFRFFLRKGSKTVEPYQMIQHMAKADKGKYHVATTQELDRSRVALGLEACLENRVAGLMSRDEKVEWTKIAPEETPKVIELFADADDAIWSVEM